MTETILLVDAKPTALKSLSDLLTKEGYQISNSKNEAEAIRIIEEFSPGLVLVNAKQEDTNGIEICKNLKANATTSEIPIIFLDENILKADRVKVFNSGAVDFIELPFEESEVLIKVKTQIDLGRLERGKLEVETKLSRLEKLAQTGNWELNVAKNEVTWSDQLFEIFEEDKTKYTPSFESFLERVQEDQREYVKQVITEALEQQNSFSYEADIIYPNGISKRMITWGEVKVDDNGESSEMIGVSMLESKEVTNRRILGRIADITSIVGGTEYFDTICNFLTVNLSIDYAFVGEYYPETNSMKSLSFSLNGKILDPMEYQLENTPCENVLGKEMCYYTRDSQKLFPLDDDLKMLDVEGYIGVPLFDGETPLGIIVLLSKSPLLDGETDRIYVQGLVKRTQAEMIRFKKDRELETHVKEVEEYIDKSDAKKAELALKASEERLSLATKAGSVGIWDWDVKNNVLTWDDSMYILYDMKRSNFSGDYDAWLSSLHSEDKIQAEKDVGLALSGEKEFDTEFRIVNKAGATKHISAKGDVQFENGEPVRMFGANTDITELVNAKMRLRTYLNKVEASNKELESFAYVASHDLQEPLRVITSYLQLIESRYKESLDEKGMDFIERVIGASGRMKELINDLLDFSRIETGGSEFLDVDIEELVNLALKDLEVTIESNKAVITMDKLPPVVGDKSQIHRVFVNVLNNAIKYRTPDVDPIIKITAVKKGEMIEFSIEDNGIGIEGEYHERIFDIFQRLHTRDEYSGTGLGLAITKKIIERHGGKISLTSNIGQGTTIIFTLPIRSDW